MVLVFNVYQDAEFVMLIILQFAKVVQMDIIRIMMSVNFAQKDVKLVSLH